MFTLSPAVTHLQPHPFTLSHTQFLLFGGSPQPWSQEAPDGGCWGGVGNELLNLPAVDSCLDTGWKDRAPPV